MKPQTAKAHCVRCGDRLEAKAHPRRVRNDPAITTDEFCARMAESELRAVGWAFRALESMKMRHAAVCLGGAT